MSKQHIITIAGKPGSGKSSTAKLIASELGFEHFSSGDMFRAAAKEQGKELLGANQSAEQKNDGPDLDALVDGKLRELGDTEDCFVIDSRTAWHWIPGSFKVLLDLDLSIGAQRVWNDADETRRASEHLGDNLEEYTANLQARLESENRRYRDLYNIDPYDVANYDLVVNTALYNREEVGSMVLKAYQEWVS